MLVTCYMLWYVVETQCSDCLLISNLHDQTVPSLAEQFTICIGCRLYDVLFKQDFSEQQQQKK